MGGQEVNALQGITMNIQPQRVCGHHGSVWLGQVDP